MAAELRDFLGRLSGLDGVETEPGRAASRKTSRARKVRYWERSKRVVEESDGQQIVTAVCQAAHSSTNDLLCLVESHSEISRWRYVPITMSKSNAVVIAIPVYSSQLT